ncbi:zf-HC2 domain-containing protein [Halobacillus halophilus]|uniref:zf-HC2 domain-containing protein n=1 Tax=Halobacillus halophilus TaxID=1570 RepID=UPI001CD27AEA|nr:zf-HC2 domain-containing protein [Halobacillus halophilus]MCA1012818.1 zf-HC2 domain-containing protein [Halobacillus halophilus]
MNEYERKIHKLSQELIPVFDELDAETKEIIQEHARHCSECDRMLNTGDFMDTETEKTEDGERDDAPIQPLRQLVHINRGIRVMVFLIRILVLGVISYNSLRFQEFGDVVRTFQAGTFLIYLPTAIFLIAFTWTFLNKKWVFYSIVADVIILLGIWQLPLLQ